MVDNNLSFLTPLSRQRFDTLNPDVKPIIEEFLNLCHENHFNIQITSGSRTIEEQDELYAIGRSKPGKIVTNAKGGDSNHNYGIAIDVVIINRLGECDWRPDMYRMLAEEARESGLMDKGLFWGGDWKSFKESVHFEVSGGRSVFEIKEHYPLYESSKVI